MTHQMPCPPPPPQYPRCSMRECALFCCGRLPSMGDNKFISLYSYMNILDIYIFVPCCTKKVTQSRGRELPVVVSWFCIFSLFRLVTCRVYSITMNGCCICKLYDSMIEYLCGVAYNIYALFMFYILVRACMITRTILNEWYTRGITSYIHIYIVLYLTLL